MGQPCSPKWFCHEACSRGHPMIQPCFSSESADCVSTLNQCAKVQVPVHGICQTCSPLQISWWYRPRAWTWQLHFRHHRTWPLDRVRASRLTTRLYARIRRKTTSTARASLMLQISAWLLTILQVTACMFVRNGSPFSAKDSLYIALATTVEEYAGTLANCSVKIWKFGGSSSRTSWLCVRGGAPVRSCRCEGVLGFTLASHVAWLLSHLTHAWG